LIASLDYNLNNGVMRQRVFIENWGDGEEIFV